jgi:secreted trypsin-like serine protease
MRRVLRPRVAGIAATALGIVLTAPSLASASRGPHSPIVHGSGVRPGEYPWQVALMRTSADDSSRDGNGFSCGGTLISPRRVLTAAHCVLTWNPDELEVMAGKQRLSQVTPADRYAVASIAQAPVGIESDKPFDTTDLALVTLAKPVVNARPLRLIGPEGGGDDALWSPGTTLRASGWGKQEDGSMPDLLQVASVKRVDDERCARNYKGMRRENFVCAGNLAQPSTPTSVPGICYGDSGGPLAAPAVAEPDPRDPADWRLVGTVNATRRCGSPDAPALYARLAAPWAQRFTHDPNPTPQPRREAKPRFASQPRRGTTVRCLPARFSGAVTKIEPPSVSLGGFDDEAEVREIPNDGSYVLTADDVGKSLLCEQFAIGPGGAADAITEAEVLPGGSVR